MESVIVTGSEGLIGKEICQYLDDEGFLVLAADLKFGDDFTDEKFVKKYFKNPNHKASHLINLFAMNHHISTNKDQDLYGISMKSFQQYINVNLSALFSVCREYARNNKIGNIINFASTYGMVSPQPNMYQGHKHPGYVISKFGVIGLTKYLACHLAPGIRVNCISPGGIHNQQDKKFIKEYSKRTPMRRMMNVDELNKAVKFLCEDTYSTGAIFTIDGGWTAW